MNAAEFKNAVKIAKSDADLVEEETGHFLGYGGVVGDHAARLSAVYRR